MGLRSPKEISIESLSSYLRLMDKILHCLYNFQGTNISPKAILKMIFLFPRWDMLVFGRVLIVRIAIHEEDGIFASESMSMQMYKLLSVPNLYTSMQFGDPSQ